MALPDEPHASTPGAPARSGGTLRDVADTVGITERAAQRIVTDLVEAGYVERTRVGRRNTYKLDPHRHMRHPEQTEYEIGELLELLRGDPDAK